MFKNYLITAWRNIVKNGLFSVINIFGLAIGLMSCILIMLFVRNESGYDQWLKNSDQLVRMHTAYTMPNQPAFKTVRSAGKMMEAIRDYASNEIADGVRFIQWGMTVQHNDNGFAEELTMVDGSFFNLFDLPFAHGDQASSFAKPMDTLITEDMAIKYFGRTDVIGETITICCVGESPTPLAITGVIKNLPDATHLNINMLVYLQPALFQPGNGVTDTWTSLNVYTYFKLNEGVSTEQLQGRIDYWLNNESPLSDMLLQFLGDAAKGKQVTDMFNLHVMPVPDLHLNAIKDAGNMGDLTPMGDSNMINTFMIVAALVLLIACINFMNLSTAKASKRAKEVAMRKVLGASRGQVAVQFLAEAIALVLVSLFFALVAVELVLPIYNELLATNLTLELLDDPMTLLMLIGAAVLVGAVAGSYPAIYLSRFMPGETLKSSKNAESSSSAKLRTLLVVFQFCTSIVLVIATLVVYGQTKFANSMNVGYQSDNKMVLNIRGAGEQLESLRLELLSLPEINAVSYSSESPTQDNENNNNFKLLEVHEGGSANEAIPLNMYNMGYGFFEDYQIQPIAGRLFDQAFGTDTLTPNETEGEEGRASALINETALRKLGFSNAEQAVGKTLQTSSYGGQQLTIIGVIPDVYFRSIKFGIRASIYMLNPSRFRVANISFTSNNSTALFEKVENIWNDNVPMQPMNLQFLSQMMQAQYENERTTAQLFLVFSVLAILIACLGLYGLSAFTVDRRTKEIGIRKVMGAGIADIVKLLVWQFSKPVAIANAIAWPIAIYAMLQWLEAFPYRMDSIWLLPICLGVGAISLIIAWLTVGGIAAKVAGRNPINALRYE